MTTLLSDRFKRFETERLAPERCPVIAGARCALARGLRGLVGGRARVSQTIVRRIARA